MRKPRPQMVTGAVQENLRLVLKTPKRTRMNDPRTVALKLCPISVAWLGICSPARFARFLRKRRESGAFGHFHFLSRSPTFVHWPLIPGYRACCCHAEALALLHPITCSMSTFRRPALIFRAMRAALGAPATAARADRTGRARAR